MGGCGGLGGWLWGFGWVVLEGCWVNSFGSFGPVVLEGCLVGELRGVIK